MNGVPIEEKYLTEEDFEEQLLTILMKETQTIQRAVYKNQLTDQQVANYWYNGNRSLKNRVIKLAKIGLTTATDCNFD